jgi:RNA polymerase sigma factor (sigma-70 family)
VSLSREEQLKLFDEHVGLAIYWANKYLREILEIEDLQQAALMGLWVAATRFDPDLGDFPQYATRWIKNHLSDESRHRHVVVMSERDFKAGRDWFHSAEMPPLPVDGGQDVVADRLDVAKAMDNLKPPEREATALSYGIGTERPLEPREVAVRMGISVTMMNRYRQHARAKLARAFSRSRAG